MIMMTVKCGRTKFN